MRPHRQQPTRLLCPWDSPGKNTGVGCHFLLQCMKVKSKSEVTQSCPTLSDPMDCSLLGSSVHGIFQARVLEWVAIAFSDKKGRNNVICSNMDGPRNCHTEWSKSDRESSVELGCKSRTYSHDFKEAGGSVGRDEWKARVECIGMVGWAVPA